MTLQQFKYVLAVAQYRHFELAAESCFVTQSTLSTMISKLEDELGLKIFDRSKKPVEIIPEGALIIDQLKIVMSDIGQMEELVKEIKGEIKGRLTISVIPTIAPFLLPLFLQDFAGKFPELNIEVKEQTTDTIIKQLKSRVLDIGIVSIPLEEKDLIEIKLYDEPFVLFDASLKSHNSSPHSKMDLSNIWLMEEGHCMRTQALQLCNQNKKGSPPSANFDFKAGSIDSLLRFVKANKGSTLLPYLSVLQFSEKEKNQVKHFSTPVPLRTVGVVVHKHFVQKKILELLTSEIQLKVAPLLPEAGGKGGVISPLVS